MPAASPTVLPLRGSFFDDSTSKERTTDRPQFEMTDPRVEYERRLVRWRERSAAHERRHLRVSNARLAAAAAIAVLAWLSFFRRSVPPWWVAAAGAGFTALIVYHARVLQRLERSRRAARLYERGLDRDHRRNLPRVTDQHDHAEQVAVLGQPLRGADQLGRAAGVHAELAGAVLAGHRARSGENRERIDGPARPDSTSRAPRAA